MVHRVRWSSQTSPPEGYEYAADNNGEQQARFLLRAFEMARQKGYVGVMFVWNLNFASVAGPSDEKAGFSLIRRRRLPAPGLPSAGRDAALTDRRT